MTTEPVAPPADPAAPPAAAPQAPAAPASPAPPAAPAAPEPAPAGLTVPGADAKPEDWDAFYSKIGRPEKPDGYQFAKPDGFDSYSDQMAGWFKNAAHKAGLDPRQAASMHDAYVEMAKGQGQQSAEAAARQEAELSAEMDKTWGTQKGAKLELAKRGAREFGFDGDTLDKLETKVGSFKMLDAFARIGEAIGEDTLHRGSGPSSGPNPWVKDTLNLTRQAKIMREDPALAARLMAQAGVKQPA